MDLVTTMVTVAMCVGLILYSSAGNGNQEGWHTKTKLQLYNTLFIQEIWIPHKIGRLGTSIENYTLFLFHFTASLFQ